MDEVPTSLSNFYMDVSDKYFYLSCRMSGVQKPLFSILCGMEVYSVEKAYVSTDVAVRTSNWSRDDSRHVEFFSIQVLFTPLQIVLVAKYFISPFLMVENTVTCKKA